MTLSAGTLLGPYRIEALIGAGGMGEVYRARDTRLGRVVAVKVLGERATDVGVRQRFEREATAIARVVHPHICRLYDVGREGDVSFLVMEYLEGDTLAHRIACDPMSVQDVVTIAIDMAEAVHAAHQQGLVHRDLKPSNVMLTSDGVKLLDFGLVRFLAEEGDPDANAATTLTLTGEGGVVGTIQYMSPEQIQGRPIDARCDVFAIGAIVYEMLAGLAPFVRSSSIGTIAAIITDDPAPLQQKRPDVSPGLLKIIDRCLAKDPGHRWANAAALSASLRAHAQPARRQSPTPAKQPRVTPPSATIRRVAVLPVRNVSGDADQNYLADGVTEALMSALVKIQGLQVISRASANRFVDAGADVAALARVAGVDAFVEGSVARSGERLRVAVRLVSARTSSHIWAATYDRAWGDLLTLESDIANNVAAEVQLKLRSGERRRAIRRQTNPAAQDAYLRGRFVTTTQRGAEALRLSLKHFTTALELDPDYTLAHAALADWYLTAAFARLVPPAEAIPKAKAAAVRALELGPRLAEAHSCLGRVATYEWNLALARTELETALRINPNLAAAELGLGRLFAYLRQFEPAIEHNRIAQRLDPLSPTTHVSAGAVLYCAHRFDQAIAEAQRGLELTREFGNALYLIGLCEYFRGNAESALEYLVRAQRVSSEHPSPVSGLIFVFGRLGRHAEAVALLDQLKERATRADVSPYDFAEAYVGLGHVDLAIEHLQRSYALRLPELLGIGSDPIFDAIRSEPRFMKLAADIGLAL